MKAKEFITEGVESARPAEILKALQALGNKRIVWRGMSGGTIFCKVDNSDRSAFKGGILPQVGERSNALNIKNPAFGSFHQSIVSMFGTPNIMIPVQPYRAIQSEKLQDLAHDTDLDLGSIVDSYSERMDVEDSEVIFDIQTYYMISIQGFLQIYLDPEGFYGGKIYPKIKEMTNTLKTYDQVAELVQKYIER